MIRQTDGVAIEDMHQMACALEYLNTIAVTLVKA